MNDIFIGILFSGITVLIFEFLSSSDRKLIAALILTGTASVICHDNWCLLLQAGQLVEEPFMKQ